MGEAEGVSRKRAPRIDPVVQALRAYKEKGDLSALAALWSASDRTVLSDADWEAIKEQAVEPNRAGDAPASTEPC